ncbi:MAG TPA: helix-turn-helix transcriptional regulator [Actinocrinis sp.]|jgi:transcriptional regulator with XRE-family HTH domain|nr:helix-turn-helix transcriptional regulator [Actinocrinis sp.]HEV3169962.1 helix-turn-helix transcriptional regulator [Actinocrinis sp.]
MILIRRLLGDVLRRKRQDEGRTLRQLAAEARISPGYLSEIERGQKEPSSELLAAICDALSIRLSDLLREVSIDLEAAELAAALEAERVGAPVPGARVGSAAVSKAAALAKPVARTAGRPGARPAPRPVTRRVPPVAASAGVTGQVPVVPAAMITQTVLEGPRRVEGPVVTPLGALGPVGGTPLTAIGMNGDPDRVRAFPLVNMGDFALR